MTAWVLAISKDFPDHWDFAQKDGFWDTPPRTKIEPADDIFFWMAGTGHRMHERPPQRSN
ncbi:hypothetical protein Pd630_LPD05819 [Rhodococcus opacus PD630]|nr:hypothetical protein Pd630_LPD05819 [Rhodococcus opacus PD630]